MPSMSCFEVVTPPVAMLIIVERSEMLPLEIALEICSAVLVAPLMLKSGAKLFVSTSVKKLTEELLDKRGEVKDPTL